MDKSIEIFFEHGLPGFENLQHFSITRAFAETELYYLQSTEEPDVCFLCINPFQYTKQYEFTMPEPIQQALSIKRLEDVAVFNIVTINGDLEQATVNLQAPVIINISLSQGMQVVLNDPALHIREPLKSLLQGTVEK
ncbi:flagellar assembly protein FliW [Desulforamulus aeronauticus]|uniref:Flagellar assembly factor FliW n=1 Tax=Desulforamulus aeronauticus DSM 10349 TaxID=1121421 RepID=A0A1M6RDL3_9FIRM|nr:flagellar assembly protein FliW [Desulforamulus aeronauticus]SHK30448.1 flagellar assembly factor FliW [Desulforamulus aeronauticus DSM 10349]